MSDDDLIRRGDARRVMLAYASSYSAEEAETAIAALPAVTPGVKVKPLVWEKPAEQRRSLMYRAHGCHGLVYEIFGDGAWFAVYGPGRTRLSGALPTIDAAKAAAQADYEARILAALDLTPQPALTGTTAVSYHAPIRVCPICDIADCAKHRDQPAPDVARLVEAAPDVISLLREFDDLARDMGWHRIYDRTAAALAAMEGKG